MDHDLAVELITEYNDWAIQKRALSGDVSPQQFLVERAQATALGRLIKADEYIATLDEELFESVEMQTILRIING